MYYISKDNLFKLLEALKADYEVYVPNKKDDRRFYKKYTGFTSSIAIGEVRACEPLKSFFFRAREKVVRDFEPDIPCENNKPLAIVGVKACDLKGFKIQDYVFQDHDYQDPFYIKWRRENLIISADCTSSIDTCFCLALDVQPCPNENFDINLSEIKGGFIADSGSAKGKAIIDKHHSLFKEAEEKLLIERGEQRSLLKQKVDENIKKNNLPSQHSYKGIIEKKYEADIWQDEAKTCVECGACNSICPTCHCFLLYDQKNRQRLARLRIWDSCMLKDFARVAGGANPRSKLWMRLRNRFEKKFDFFPKTAGIYACTGCGRCISACPAKIDIRKVLKRLVNENNG